MFAELRGLTKAREKIEKENRGKLPDIVIANMLAPIDKRIGEITGLLPSGIPPANTAEAAPFREALPRTQ